jgi:hypothetical protein
MDGTEMGKKKTNEQKQHDACVREIADQLKQENWSVKANVEGAEKPFKIGEFMPDVEASKKGCLPRICQVLTEKDFKGDKKAYIEFKNYCDEYDFHFYVVDEDGKRREVDPKTLNKK